MRSRPRRSCGSGSGGGDATRQHGRPGRSGVRLGCGGAGVWVSGTQSVLGWYAAALTAVSPFLVAVADPISGGAGWAGAGLLGLVLAWLLLVHLPSKDKQLKDFIDAHNASVAAMRETFEREQTEVRATF